MTHRIITLACLLLLALAPVVPEASAQDARSGPAEAAIHTTREEPTLMAHRRRHCHTVKGHYRRNASGRRVYVPAHRHCHTRHRHVA
jgi:hypothetical protein